MSFSFFPNMFSLSSFSNPCLFPWQAVQASFRVEEMTNYCHRQMKEEEGRCIATVKAFQVADKSLQEHKKRLQEEEKERKYAAAALENVEKQAESQRLLLHSAENQIGRAHV